MIVETGLKWDYNCISKMQIRDSICYQQLTQIYSQCILSLPPENLSVFRCFQGVEKGLLWEQMG